VELAHIKTSLREWRRATGIEVGGASLTAG